MKRSLRKILSLVLTVSLCLSLLPAPRFSGAQAASVLDYLQAQADGDTLFFQSGDGICSRRIDETALSTPWEADEQLLFPYDNRLLNTLSPDGHPLSSDSVLFIWDHQPALLDYHNRCIWKYQNSTFLPVLETEEIGDMTALTQYVACNDEQGLLWFLQKGRLVRCDLATGRITRLPLSNLTEMARHGDGVIALQTTGHSRDLIRLSPGSDTPEVLASLPAPGDGGIAVDHQHDTIYAIVDGMISRLEGGAWTGILPFSLSPYSQLTFISGQSYCYVDDSGPHGVSLALGSSDYLSVRGLMPFNQVMDSEYLLSAPAMPILRQTALRFSAEDIFLDIQSDNQSVDLYLIQMSTGLRQLMEKGYLAPITSPVLTADSQGLYPFAREACTRNGTLYAYPVTLLSDGWAVKAGWEATPPPQDLFELLAMERQRAKDGETLPAAGEGYGAKWTKMDYAAYALKQHVLSGAENPPAFTGSRFAAFLEEVAASDFLSDEETDTAFTDELCPGIWNMVGLSFYGHQTPEGILTRPPALDRDQAAVVPAAMYVYVVNPRSQHLEEAIAYLEYLSQHKDAEMHAFLYRDAAPARFSAIQEEEAEIAEDIRQQKALLLTCPPEERRDVEDHIQSLEEDLSDIISFPGSWAVYPDTLATYQRDYAPHISLGLTPFLERTAVNSAGLYETIISRLREALQGSIPPSEALRRIDVMVQQYQQENK